VFRLLPQCWPHSFASLSFFFATSFRFFACRILASCCYLEFLLQYNSVLKRLDQPPLLKKFFFKNPAKKAFFSYKSSHVFVNLLEYGRHVARLRRRRRRRAYAPTSNTASHETMRKSTHGFPFFPMMPMGLCWAALRAAGSSAISVIYLKRLPLM